MELSRDLLFFFSALGAFNSFLLGAYLLLSGKRYPAAYFFIGLILLFFSIRAGVSCLYYFGDIPRHLIKLGLGAHLLLGPSAFYLVQFSLSKAAPQWKNALIHLTTLAATLIAMGFTFDFYQWDYNIRYSIHALLTLYLVVTGIKLYPTIKTWLLPKTAQLTKPAKEALAVYLGLVFICLGFVVSLYTTYILGPLVFSITFYTGIALRLIKRNKGEEKQKYQNKLDQEEVSHVISRLKELMEEQKPYKDPEFSMSKLSNQLSVSRHFLSQLLNDNMQLRYTDLINQYRIEEACRLIESNTHFNLEAIAYEVGFNSKSTFYATFKKLKGSTPSQYRSALQV